MSNNTKALKSGVWYTAANFLTSSIGLITTPIFTRLLTKADFGAYSNYTSWLSIFSVLLTLNLGTTFISARFDYKDKFDDYISSSLILSTLTILLGTIIVNILYVPFRDKFGIDRIYLNCMMIYLAMSSAIAMFQTKERYEFKYKISVFVSLLITISTSVLSVLLVTILNDKLEGRIFGAALPTIIVGFIIYIYLLRNSQNIQIKYWKYALPIALPYIPHILSMSLLNSMDRIMITDICGKEQNALYSLAYTCGSIITILVNSMNTAYSPWLGHKLNEDTNESFIEVKKFSRVYIGVFSFVCIGIMLVTPEVLLILGGKQYMESKYVMPPITCGVSCQFLYTMFVSVEQYKKKTVGMAIASVSAALLNYGLNAFFIPRFGYIAAAYTTLAGYLWLLAAHMFLVKRLGYAKTYDYKFVIGVTALLLAITAGVNFIYNYTIIRYAVILVYGGITVFIAVKYGKILIERYKSIKAKK